MKLTLISFLLFLGIVGIFARLAPNEGRRLAKHPGFDDTQIRTGKDSLRKVRDSEDEHDGSGEGDGSNKGEGGSDGESKGNSTSSTEAPNNSTQPPGNRPSIPGLDEFQHFFSQFFHEFQYNFGCMTQTWANVTRAFFEQVSRNPTAKRTIKLEINDKLIYEQTVENGTISCPNNARPHQQPNLIQEGIVNLFGDIWGSKRRHGHRNDAAKRLHEKEHDRSKRSRKGKSLEKHQRHHSQRKKKE